MSPSTRSILLDLKTDLEKGIAECHVSEDIISVLDFLKKLHLKSGMCNWFRNYDNIELTELEIRNFHKEFLNKYSPIKEGQTISYWYQIPENCVSRVEIENCLSRRLDRVNMALEDNPEAPKSYTTVTCIRHMHGVTDDTEDKKYFTRNHQYPMVSKSDDAVILLDNDFKEHVISNSTFENFFKATPQTINDIYALWKEVARLNPDAVLTGSLALVKLGFNIRREPSDIDILLYDRSTFVYPNNTTKVGDENEYETEAKHDTYIHGSFKINVFTLNEERHADGMSYWQDIILAKISYGHSVHGKHRDDLVYFFKNNLS